MTVSSPPVISVPPSRQRDFAGWITLAVIFLLLIAQTFAPQPASSKIDLGEAQTTLRTAVGNLNSPNPVLSRKQQVRPGRRRSLPYLPFSPRREA